MALDPSFIHLWTLSTAFVLMHVKTDFVIFILNYILPFLYKGRMILIVYHKYGTLFTEIFPLPAFCAMRVY